MKQISFCLGVLLLLVTGVQAQDSGLQAARLGLSGQIVYVSNRGEGYEIHVINADGSGEQQLTDEPEADNYGPVWSPDGTQIVYTHAPHTGGRSFYVMKADGSNPVALTDDAAPEISGFPDTPLWSPDSRRLIYGVLSRDGDQQRLDVYSIRADGTERAQITYDLPENVRPELRWTRDNHILLRQRSGVYQLEADGSNPIRISNRGNLAVFGLSPDESQVVSWSGIRGIELLDQDFSHSQGLPDLPEKKMPDELAWSPDRVYVTATIVPPSSESVIGTYILNVDAALADGADWVKISDDYYTTVWSPDGKFLAYQKQTDEGWHIFVTKPAADMTPVQITDTGDNAQPSWGK